MNIILHSKERVLFFIILPVTLVVKMIALYILHPKSTSRQWLSYTATCFSSPLEKVDHHELVTSECIDSYGVQKHQSMIGTIQWDICLGRLDGNTVVMTLASFRAEPR